MKITTEVPDFVASRSKGNRGWLEIEFIHETHFFYIRHPKDVYMRVNGRDVNCIDMKTGQAQFYSWSTLVTPCASKIKIYNKKI